MKPRNVSVSLVENGKDEVKAWCVSFTLKGSLRKNGKVNEDTRKRMQNVIQKFLESVDFPDLTNGEGT